MKNVRLGNLFPVTVFVCVGNQSADLATGTQSASVAHTQSSSLFQQSAQKVASANEE